jgi:hypothetical protein
MSIAFVHFCLIVPLLYPVAVVLFASNGMGGCLRPTSSNVVRNKNCPYFRFRCRRHYVFENCADDQNCPVGKFGGCVSAATHVEESACYAIGFSF